ncbi:MAG: hypothetical protein LBM21_00150 [Coriobacteriales bacterium]|nr:hypothetical protein [Coriobacteriales bacterium]
MRLGQPALRAAAWIAAFAAMTLKCYVIAIPPLRHPGLDPGSTHSMR